MSDTVKIRDPYKQYCEFVSGLKQQNLSVILSIVDFACTVEPG